MGATRIKAPSSTKRILAGMAAVIALVLLMFAPRADAEGTGPGAITEGPWSGSQFDNEGLRGGHLALGPKSNSTAITGIFKRGGGYVITSLSDNNISGGPTTAGCGPIETRSQVTGGSGASRTFEIQQTTPDAPSTSTINFPCNGTYTVTVTAHACELDLLNNCTNRRDEATLSARIGVAVPPQPATDVAALLRKSESTTTTEPGVPIPADNDESGSSSTAARKESEPDTATIDVSWTYPENPEPDATYVVQRADPGSETFNDLGEGAKATEKPTDPNTAHTQTDTDTVTTNGTYQYRVAALRPNVDPVPSESVSVKVTGLPVDAPPSEDEDEDDEDVSPPATSSSSITIPSLGSSGRLPRSSSSSKVTIPNLSPPTTEDTGFNETLDYGDLEEPGELAAEGQSIINSDVDGLDLMPSIAGAMVLVGWAAHVLYLTRLARQF